MNDCVRRRGRDKRRLVMGDFNAKACDIEDRDGGGGTG